MSALFPVPHSSLITLTHDETTQPAYAAPRQSQAPNCVLDRIAQGDACAVRECLDQFGPLIWAIARRMTSTSADAEQAVHEIFLDVWRSAGCFDAQRGSEAVFVTMIARRRLIERARRGAPLSRTRVSNGIDGLGWKDPGESPDFCAEALAAARAVMQLRPALRALLKLGVLRGLSHSEIARELQLPLDTVKTLMCRALIQVREYMEL